MKPTHTTILLLLLFLFQQSNAHNFSWPDGHKTLSRSENILGTNYGSSSGFSDSDSILSAIDSLVVSTSSSFLAVTLFEGDTENRTMTINNNGSEDLTLGLSLTNTSHDTELNQRFLTPPELFRVGWGQITRWDAVNNDRLWTKGIRIPKDIPYDPDGLAFDGVNLYFVGSANSGIIYKIDIEEETFIDSRYIPELDNAAVQGLAHSGEFLFAANIDNDTIYKIDFDSGMVIDHIYLENLGSGLTWGGNRGTLFASRTGYDISEINVITKEVINTFQSPTSGTPGLGYSKAMDVIYTDYHYYEGIMLNPNDGSVVGISYIFAGSIAADEQFGLKWLDFETLEYKVNGSSSRQIELSFDASDLGPGIYKTTAQFALNDGSNSAVSLPVELTVLPLVEDVTLESFCSLVSGEENIWKIYNPNNFEIKARWDVKDSNHGDSITLQSGENVLFTPTLADTTNVLNISWLNERGIPQENSIASNNEVCKIKGLTLNPICAENLETHRDWEIVNPNLFGVTVTWNVEGTTLSGVLEASSGKTQFSTPVDSIYEVHTLRISWFNETGQIKRQRKLSSTAPCHIRGLTLKPVCSEEPELSNKWEVINPNAFFVSVDWVINGTEISGNLNADAGSSFFYTTADIENQTVKISWRDEGNNIRRQQKLWDLTDCSTSTPTVARKSAIRDEKAIEVVESTKVFPNPFNDRLNLKMSAVEEGSNEYTLRVHNMLGMKVYETRVQSTSGVVNADINTSELTKGTYILTLNSALQTYRITVIKN